MMIYEALLVSSDDIIITETAQRDRETLELNETTRIRRCKGPEPELFSVNILLVSKWIYEEAAPVLYGHNTFSFLSLDGCGNFRLFESRLTNISRNEIRRLELHLPGNQVTWDCFKRSAGNVLPHLKTLPKLELLRLQLKRDLGSGLFGLMQSLEESTGNAEVRLVIGCHDFVAFLKRLNRTVCIDVRMIEAMRRWGWTTTGEFDVKRFECSGENEMLIATRSISTAFIAQFEPPGIVGREKRLKR